jgi:hypothetical protein
MSNKLLDFYKSTLGFCSMAVSNTGFIKLVLAGSEGMCMIEGKSLILPIPKRMKEFDFEKEIIFHPMTESIVRGESEVQEKMRLSFVSKMNFAVFTMMCKLLEIAKDGAKHINLDPAQADFLKVVKDVDQTCYDNFREFGLQIIGGKKVEWKFMDMRLKKGGMYKAKKVDKLGIVFFPFYEKLARKEAGKLRVSDTKVYKALFEYIFNVADDDAYNRPCHGNAVAPYFTSFLSTAVAVAIPMNDLVSTFASYLDSDETEICGFDLSWHDQLVNIESLLPDVRKIPAQMGNLGRVEPTVVAEEHVTQPVKTALPAKEEQSVVNALSGLAAAVHIPHQVAPVYTPPPLVMANTNEAPSLSSALRASGLATRTMQAGFPMGGVMPAGFPAQPVYQQPGMLYPQPGMGMGFPQQQQFPTPNMMGGFQQPGMGMGFPQQQFPMMNNGMMGGGYPAPVMGMGASMGMGLGGAPRKQPWEM